MNNQTNQRVVMCFGQWPEENYQDFMVFSVRDDESDEEALARAKASSQDERDEFYVTTQTKG